MSFIDLTINSPMVCPKGYIVRGRTASFPDGGEHMTKDVAILYVNKVTTTIVSWPISFWRIANTKTAKLKVLNLN